MEKAQKVVDEQMIARGLAPNEVTCNTLVKGWAQKGEMDEAQTVVDGMVQRRLTPDAVSFNTLLNGCDSNFVFVPVLLVRS